MASDDTKFKGTKLATGMVVGLLVVASALLFQAVLIQIEYKPSNWPTWITRHPFLGTDPAIALIVGLVTVLGVTWQFKAGLRPILNNTRDEDASTITVDVENAGLGPAIIKRATYKLLVGSGPPTSFGNVQELRTALRAMDVDPERYIVWGFRTGTSIRKEGTRRVAQLPEDVKKKVKQISVVLEFRSVWGGKYSETIDCLPEAPHVT